MPGQGGVFNPVNLALYCYAGNNPIFLTDPDGEAVRITITNIKSKAFIFFDKGKLRNGPPGSTNLKTVPVYLMTVTDDVSGETTTYEVTRHSVFDSNTRSYGVNFSFEPKGKSKTFLGAITSVKNDGTPRGTGPVIMLFELDGHSRGDLYRSDTGELNNAFIEIHVGGLYYNTENESLGWATSWGCFTLNGKDAGDAGRDKFISDIKNRLNKQPANDKNIYVTVEKMK